MSGSAHVVKTHISNHTDIVKDKDGSEMKMYSVNKCITVNYIGPLTADSVVGGVVIEFLEGLHKDRLSPEIEGQSG